MPSYFEDDTAQNQVGDNAGDGMPEGSEPRGQDEDGKGNEKTALINSEICPGMKPGDVMEVKILAVHDGEYEVGYNPEEKGGEGEGDESMAGKEAPMPDSMMD